MQFLWMRSAGLLKCAQVHTLMYFICVADLLLMSSLLPPTACMAACHFIMMMSYVSNAPPLAPLHFPHHTGYPPLPPHCLN